MQAKEQEENILPKCLTLMTYTRDTPKSNIITCFVQEKNNTDVYQKAGMARAATGINERHNIPRFKSFYADVCTVFFH